MSEHDRFGELRSLVLKPSQPAWAALLDECQRWPLDAQRAAVVPYLNGHLEAWPQHLRAAPEDWCARILAGWDIGALGLVRHVQWKSQRLGAIELERLLAAPDWLRLDRLDLRWNELGPDSGRLLGSHSLSSQVEILNLWGNRLGHEGVAQLADCEMPKMRVLSLYGNNLGPQGARHLQASIWPSIEILYLGSNRIGDEGLDALLRGDEAQGLLSRLRELTLDSNRVGPRALSALAAHPMPALESLSLSFNPLDGASLLRELAQASWLPRLKDVSLYGLELDEVDLESIGELLAHHQVQLYA